MCVEVLRRAGYRVTVDQVMHVEVHCESGLNFWNVVTEAYYGWDYHLPTELTELEHCCFHG